MNQRSGSVGPSRAGVVGSYSSGELGHVDEGRCTRGMSEIARAQPMRNPSIDLSIDLSIDHNVPTFLIDQCFNEVSQTVLLSLDLFY